MPLTSSASSYLVLFLGTLPTWAYSLFIFSQTKQQQSQPSTIAVVLLSRVLFLTTCPLPVCYLSATTTYLSLGQTSGPFWVFNSCDVFAACDPVHWPCPLWTIYSLSATLQGFSLWSVSFFLHPSHGDLIHSHSFNSHLCPDASQIEIPNSDVFLELLASLSCHLLRPQILRIQNLIPLSILAPCSFFYITYFC